jgi:hypothetical protein
VPGGGFIRQLRRDPRWRDPFKGPSVYLYLKAAADNPYRLTIVDSVDSTSDRCVKCTSEVVCLDAETASVSEVVRIFVFSQFAVVVDGVLALICCLLRVVVCTLYANWYGHQYRCSSLELITLDF